MKKKQYKKKPVIVSAYQTDTEQIIHTLEGDMKAPIGSYIITGVQGEEYPCQKDIFESTYEEVPEVGILNPLNHSEYLRSMQTKSLKNFSILALEQYGTIQKLKKANKIIKVLRSWYSKRHILTEQASPVFIELMSTAAFIHNLFLTDEWISVYRARLMLSESALNCGIEPTNVEHLFTIVEAQLGADMPIVGSRPNPNNPVEDFATALWIVEEFLNE